MRYSILDTFSTSPYFGTLSQAQDLETGRVVTLLELPPKVVTFLGAEQIPLRNQLYQSQGLPVYQAQDFFQSRETMHVVYEDCSDAWPLLDYLKDKTLLQTLETLLRVSEALSLLHSRALWHGGPVPDYIFVRPNGDVRLIPMYSDTPLYLFNVFGKSDAMQYFAPETMNKSGLGTRTDIFTLGVLFYYVLTGQLPFDAEDGALYPPSKYNPHLPLQLDRLVLKMINQKPMKRFQRMGRIITELSRMIGRNEETLHADEEMFGAQHLLPSVFSGREQEMAEMRRFYDRLLSGHGGTLLLTGKPGSGRRTLAYEIAGMHLSSVSAMMATPKEKPWSVVEEFVMIFLTWCFATPEFENIAKAYIGRLAHVFPRVTYEFKDRVPPDESSKAVGLSEIAEEFLTKVIEADNKPFLFIISDVHLADSDSLRMLFNMCALEKLAVGVAGMADEATPRLTELFADHLPLNPISLDQLREVLLSRFGDANFLNQDFLHWLHYHSQGTIGRAFQLIEYLADTKQLYLQRDSWHMRASSVEELNVPQSAELLVLFRLQQLPSTALDMMQVMSMFQGTILLEVVAGVLGLEHVNQMLPVLHQLEEYGLLRHTQNRYRLPSHNLKSDLYLSISEENRAWLHRELADALLRAGSTDYTELAHHMELGGVRKQAVLFHILAARQSMKKNMVSDAEAEARRALALYEELPDRKAPRSLHLLLAETLSQSGKIMDACNIYRPVFEETGRLSHLLLLLMGYLMLRQYPKIKPYVELLRANFESNLSPKQRVHLMIVLGMYVIEMEYDTNFVLLLDDYHRKHGTALRKSARVQDYIRWVSNLQSMLRHVPGTNEHRLRYLYEAATLAEHHNLRRQQALLYISLGTNFHERNPVKAKDYYLRSEKMLIELGDKHNLMILHTNLIDANRLLGDISHAYRYLNKATENMKSATPFLINQEAETLLFVENYLQADQTLKRLAQVAKAQAQPLMRQQAFLYRFLSCVGQKQERLADRMWPSVQRLLDLRKNTAETRLIRAKYLLLKKQYEQVIDDLWPILEEETPLAEQRIKQQLALLEAMVQTERWKAGLKLAKGMEADISRIRYYGYLPWVHLYLGRLYQATDNFVQSALNFKQAQIGFRKLNHHERLLEIEQRMHETDLQMQDVATSLVQHAPADLALHVPSFEKWVGNVARERYDAIDTLAENEIVLDAIKRISSSIVVRQVCGNLASVMFENILIDHIHLAVKISEDRLEKFHLDVQLQSVPQVTHDVHLAIDRVFADGEPVELQTADAQLYVLPIFSHDSQVIAAMALEKLSNQSTFTERELRFLHRMSQLVSSNMENAIMYEAMITDNLTGLYTRNYFMKRIQEEFTKVGRYGIDLSFLMIDLDDFRLINNTFGHNEGDRVLRQVGQVLRKAVRNVDIVGRFGGEELIVILPNTNGTGAKNVAERLLQNLRAIPVEGSLYQITASVGVASVDLDHPSDAHDLLEKADRAELCAKRHGKNRVICHWEMSEQEQTREKAPLA